MTLLHLKRQLEIDYDLLTSIVIGSSDGPGNTDFSNLKNYRLAVEDLDSLGLFQTIIADVRRTAIFGTLVDRFKVNPNEAEKIVNNVARLQEAVSALVGALGDFSMDEPETIAIRLPNTKNFDDLERVSNDLKKSISIPIADPEIRGEVKIVGVDNGSIWLYITVGGPVAVSLVAALAWAGTVVYKKLQEGRAFRAYVDNLNMKNEQTSLFLDAQKVLISDLIIEQAKEVEGSSFKESSPERLERIKLSITTLSGLINDGFEIHPSILAPEESRNLFPDFKSLHFPTFTAKQIMSGDNGDSD